MYFVHRNSQKFGPYTVDALITYVQEGKILMGDQASEEHDPGTIKTVRYFLARQNRKVTIANQGSLAGQIKSIGKELIIPDTSFVKKDLVKDPRLLFLASIGLAPAFLITFTFGTYLTFYAIALYFSVIWGLFFYYMFRTPQVDKKNTISIFFLTQITAFVLVNLQKLPPLSFLYRLADSHNFFLQLTGFIFGVGFMEETIKALPLLFLIRRAKAPMIPQTMVFYGLISGIGFGVLEGVLYQTSINTQLAYNEAFFMNIARLTSLPFLHAIWAGIAGYFISFANLMPRYRKSLYFLAIAIPAVLHGLYDVLGWNLWGLASTLISVLLLVYYLKRSNDYQSKLINFR